MGRGQTDDLRGCEQIVRLEDLQELGRDVAPAEGFIDDELGHPADQHSR